MRFGAAKGVLVTGEGIETVLSVVTALPGFAAIAALTANHLVTLDLPSGLRRLYVAVDNDPEGQSAFARLLERHPDLEIRALLPSDDDFNTDLQAKGTDDLRASLLRQIAPEDVDHLCKAGPVDRLSTPARSDTRRPKAGPASNAPPA